MDQSLRDSNELFRYIPVVGVNMGPRTFKKYGDTIPLQREEHITTFPPYSPVEEKFSNFVTATVGPPSEVIQTHKFKDPSGELVDIDYGYLSGEDSQRSAHPFVLNRVTGGLEEITNRVEDDSGIATFVQTKLGTWYPVDTYTIFARQNVRH